MVSFVAKQVHIKNKKWWLLDAKNLVLGRLASRAAFYLMGKHKHTWESGAKMGDFVIIINSDHVKVTRDKMSTKKYYRHTGYLGGLKESSLEECMKKDSTNVIRLAIKRMLCMPKLQILERLKIYTDDVHPHAAQMPVALDVGLYHEEYRNMINANGGVV